MNSLSIRNPALQPVPPIRTDSSNRFAHHTMAERLPEIIRQVQRLNRHVLSPYQQAALDRLHADLTGDAPIRMLNLPAPDYDQWRPAVAAHEGETWQNTEWFFGETYFFRQMIQATQWWQNGIDPYLPLKQRELAGDRYQNLLDAALAVDPTQDENLSELIGRALWGNRSDLSHPAQRRSGDAIRADELLVDERASAVEQLLEGQGRLHIIADNAGTELTMDLILVRACVMRGIPVTVHLKMHPTYVSDATPEDVWQVVGEAESGTLGEPAVDWGRDLRQALATGAMHLAPDLFWNSCHFLNELPPRLQECFADARLVILKGDANYRRAVHDAIYQPETPFADVVCYFPGPLLVLRTLKSDAVIGLPEGLAERMDQTSGEWRVSGQYGVIQYAGDQSF